MISLTCHSRAWVLSGNQAALVVHPKLANITHISVFFVHFLRTHQSIYFRSCFDTAFVNLWSVNTCGAHFIVWL